MNKLIIKDITVEDKKLIINYNKSGVWEEYLGKENCFIAEYSEDITDVPSSILMIPLLTTLLPISWVIDGEIIIDKIDNAFYESIIDIKKGYMNMYPQIDFRGELTINEVIENRLNNESALDDERALVMYTGGVDAFNTLITHYNKKPLLLTVWGADTGYYDVTGWDKGIKNINDTASRFNLENQIVRSNFRLIINHKKLSNLVKETGNPWWYGFHHGIGLLGLTAPIAFLNNIETIYIASSHTKEQIERWNVTCASDPTIDNYVKFANTRVIHDGFEFDRQDKIRNITEFIEKNGITIQLKTCSRTSDGTNCLNCEKCYRTILGLIAEKVDLRKFGYELNKKEFVRISNDMKKINTDRKRVKKWYISIQEILRKNYTFNEVPTELRWFYDYDYDKKLTLKELVYFFSYRMNYNFRRAKNKLSKSIKTLTFNY